MVMSWGFDDFEIFFGNFLATPLVTEVTRSSLWVKLEHISAFLHFHREHTDVIA